MRDSVAGPDLLVEPFNICSLRDTLGNTVASTLEGTQQSPILDQGLERQVKIINLSEVKRSKVALLWSFDPGMC